MAGSGTIPALLVGLALLAGGCASGGNELPDFPKFPPAEDFLIMQERLERFKNRPKPPPASRYGPKNQLIYDNLERQRTYAEAELGFRERLDEDRMVRRNIDIQRRFLAQQERTARLEMIAVDFERNINPGTLFSDRFENFQVRVNRLVAEKEARKRGAHLKYGTEPKADYVDFLSRIALPPPTGLEEVEQ